jgi:hypothetical protein
MGDDTTTTLNLLDWATESPLSYSTGWIGYNGTDYELVGLRDDIINIQGADLHLDLPLAAGANALNIAVPPMRMSEQVMVCTDIDDGNDQELIWSMSGQATSTATARMTSLPWMPPRACGK